MNPAVELLAVTAAKAASRTPSGSLAPGANGTPDVTRFAGCRLDKNLSTGGHLLSARRHPADSEAGAAGIAGPAVY